MARKSASPRISLKALIPLVMMYINFKIDYKNENTLKWIRFAFMTSLTLVNMAAQLLKSKVKTANDNKRQVRIPSETDGKPEFKTVLDYDTEAVDTLSVQSFIAYSLAFALHYFMKVNPPLLMQLLMQPMTLWNAPVFRIHILGYSDEEEEYQRPWKVTGIMEQASRMQALWEAREKAQAAREAKMMRGIVKKKAAPKEGKKGK